MGHLGEDLGGDPARHWGRTRDEVVDPDHRGQVKVALPRPMVARVDSPKRLLVDGWHLASCQLGMKTIAFLAVPSFSDQVIARPAHVAREGSCRKAFASLGWTW